MSTIGKFAVLAIVIAVGFVAISAAFTASAVPHTVTNETLTQDVGNWTPVDEQDAIEYQDNETVYNATDTQLVDGTDYEWNTTNGSVYWYDTASTTDGADATISYTYLEPSESTNAVASLLSLGGRALMLVALFVGAGAVATEILEVA